MQFRKKSSQKGRSMLEAVAALAIIGILAVSGFAGIRYGLSMTRAWGTQQQIDEISKGIESLYAWEEDYANVSMYGAKGACINIFKTEDDCSVSSAWGGEIFVKPGRTNAYYSIVYTEVPRTICRLLSEMKWKNVVMTDTACASDTQTIEFSGVKGDTSCGNACSPQQVCREGQCVCPNGGIGSACIIPDLCINKVCDGECLTGACEDGACVLKPQGTLCSIGRCSSSGVCEPESTESPTTTWTDTTTTWTDTTDTWTDTWSDTTDTWTDTTTDTTTDTWTDTITTTGYETTVSYEICPDDQPLMDKNGNCYPCNTTVNVVLDTYTRGNCDVCPNRKWVNSGYTCRLDTCGPNQIMDSYGNCQSCSSSSNIYVYGREEDCLNKCPDRHLNGSYCNLACSSTTLVSGNNCASCTSSSYSVTVEDNPDCLTKCPNRKIVGEYCVVDNKCGVAGTANASKPLIDYRGNCYSCDEEAPVYMGENTDLCTSMCPNRSVNGNYCVKYQECPASAPIRDDNGRCYACDHETPITINVGASSQCYKCPNRKSWGNYCFVPCGEGVNASKPVQANYSGTCYACPTGTQSVSGFKDSCLSECPDATYVGTCKVDKCTSSATPLMDVNGNCYSCSTTSDINVGTNGVCSEKCSNRILVGTQCRINPCGTNQFMDSNGTCQSCDTASAISSSEESCKKCSNRIYKSNACRKKCPSGQMMDSYGTCRSCTYTTDIDVTGMEEDCETYCGSQRSLAGRYCYFDCSKVYPTSRPLSNYSCYACTTTSTISADHNPNCSTVCSNRKIIGQYCVIDEKCGTGTNASKPLQSTYGKCYDCYTDENVYVAGIESTCTSICPNRTLSGSYCINTCENKPLLNKSGICYSCDYAGSVSSARNCSVCSNRHLVSDYCLPNCPSGRPIQNYTNGTCYSCDEESAVMVGTTGACEEVCSNRVLINSNCYKKCGAGTFQSYANCYSCDTPEKVDVPYFTAECTKSCPNRTLTEGRYCVLK